MQPNLPFEESEDGVYRIVSALDQSKCFTLQQGSHALVIDSFHGAANQKFNIFNNNGKYAFVCLDGNLAIMLPQDSAQDGARVQADAGQHKSSFFDLTTVTNGPFAGKGFYLKTHCGKCVDVNEGRTSPGTAVIQWSYHGNSNQIWLAYPASQQGQPQQQQQQQNIQQQTQQQGAKNPFQEVPANFTPTNTLYKVLSVLNTTKALTVSNDRTLRLSDYTGDASQKFTLYPEGNKVAFVVSSLQEGLCVLKDSQ